MKTWVYWVGLALLPLAYVGVTLASGDKIEWPVFALMLLIVGPLVLFRAAINRVPRKVRVAARKTAEPDDALPPTRRVAGLVMLGLAALAYAIEYVLAHVLFIYFPLLFLPFGPLITVGALTLVHPAFFDALVQGKKYRAPVRWLAYAAVIAGLTLGVGLMLSLRGA